MTAALIRVHPADGGQLDLPLAPADFIDYIADAERGLLALVALTCAAFSEAYELAVPADDVQLIEVLR